MPPDKTKATAKRPPAKRRQTRKRKQKVRVEYHSIQVPFTDEAARGDFHGILDAFEVPAGADVSVLTCEESAAGVRLQLVVVSPL